MTQTGRRLYDLLRKRRTYTSIVSMGLSFFAIRASQIIKPRRQTVKMFNGLYKRISEQRSKSADLIRLQRAKRWNEKSILLAQIEREQTEESPLEAILLGSCSRHLSVRGS